MIFKAAARHNASKLVAQRGEALDQARGRLVLLGGVESHCTVTGASSNGVSLTDNVVMSTSGLPPPSGNTTG